MKRTPLKNKPCKHCGSTKHTSLTCFKKPRVPLRKKGKTAQKWIDVKKGWFKMNLPDAKGLYYCYIGGGKLTKSQVTLDHEKPRGSHPDKRFDLSNIKPCCYKHNRIKGSRSLKAFLSACPDMKCGNY